MGRFGKKTRKARPRWFGHVRRKDDGYDWEKDADCGGWNCQEIRRFIDAVREDVAVAEVTGKDERGRGSGGSDGEGGRMQHCRR